MIIKRLINTILCLILLSSCATHSLWNSSNRYSERVKGFLITKSGDKMVVIGDKYHYVFPVNLELKNIMISKKRKLIKPRFTNFKVDENNKISGNFHLHFYAKFEDDSEWLEDLGFSIRRVTKHGNTSYVYRGKLDGKRYKADKKVNIKESFRRSYRLSIAEPEGGAETIKKVLATPVTLTVDGLLLIGGAVLSSMFIFTKAIKN